MPLPSTHSCRYDFRKVGLEEILRQPKRELSRGGKLADQTIREFVRYFVCGQPLDEIAQSLGISRKTVRSLSINLRARLLKPALNPWHMTLDPWPGEPTTSMSSHSLLVLTLMYCAAQNCGRNFRLGNVAKRQCGHCTLPRDDEETKGYLQQIDGIYAFYEHLGWRNDKWGKGDQTFRARWAHFLTVKNAALHSRKLKNGLADPSERGYLTAGALIERLTDC